MALSVPLRGNVFWSGVGEFWRFPRFLRNHIDSVNLSMGVTIHFEGRLKSPTAYSLLSDELREYAATHNWPCESISEQQAEC